MRIQGRSGECNAIMCGTSLNIKLETVSGKKKIDIGKKARPHKETANTSD